MQVWELELSVRELRNAANELEREAVSTQVDLDHLLNAYRNILGTAARMATHLGLDAETPEPDVWHFTRK